VFDLVAVFLSVMNQAETPALVQLLEPFRPSDFRKTQFQERKADQHAPQMGELGDLRSGMVQSESKKNAPFFSPSCESLVLEFGVHPAISFGYGVQAQSSAVVRIADVAIRVFRFPKDDLPFAERFNGRMHWRSTVKSPPDNG
jgi:hypothetical protein